MYGAVSYTHLDVYKRQAISTPTGLEGWFADRVQSDDKIVSFFWGKTERRDAEIIACLLYTSRCV